MWRRSLILLVALLTAASVAAQGITIPNTFVNGTAADADQVNANFAALAANALNRTSGTMTGTLNTQVILPDADNTRNLGSAAFSFKDAWIEGTLTVGTVSVTAITGAGSQAPATSTITTTGTQTALALPSGSGNLIIFANNASLLTLQGITAGLDGQRLTIFSIGAGQVDLANQNGSASAANRIINAVTGTVSLAAGVGRVSLVYDLTVTRWRVLHHEQGDWIAVTYAAGDFTASSGTWTVDSGDLLTFKYWLKGRVLHVAWYIEISSISATPASLFMKIPGGFTANSRMVWTHIAKDAAYAAASTQVTSGATTITVWAGADLGATTWTAATNDRGTFGEVLFQVQ